MQHFCENVSCIINDYNPIKIYVVQEISIEIYIVQEIQEIEASRPRLFVLDVWCMCCIQTGWRNQCAPKTFYSNHPRR